MENVEGEDVNIQELVSNLSTYEQQLQQVRQLLDDDPKNSEYLDMEKELVEFQGTTLTEKRSFDPLVIELTEELLASAKQTDIHSGLDTGISTKPSSASHFSGSSSNLKSGSRTEIVHKFSLGTKVQAVWSEDGEWYDGTIEGHTENGYYICYDGWGNKEEVDPDNVRAIPEDTADPLLEAEKVAVATKEALKRKIAQAAAKDFQSWTVPEKLQINPNDPEDVKAAKRKKIHAFKSKMRLEEKEVTQNKRQNAWHQFQTTKGRAKKVGFFSGRKRESIFKSPDDTFGKVGVTGSGKGLTDFQKREKHLHLKGANMETADD